MILSATGIVVDHYGDVLLIERDDTRTLAPPGGAAHIGELPQDTVAREVQEETGLKVMAVRLVGLYYLPTRPNDFLSLCFRCIMRGGELTTSEESPRAGFFKTNPLPEPMLDLHKEHVTRSMAHVGGAPYWGSHQLSTWLNLGNMLINRIVYPWLHFRRRRAGLPAYEPPPSWQTQARVIVRNDQGAVLWIREGDSAIWRLPGGASAAKEPPWETAGRFLQRDAGIEAGLSGLGGVYPAADKAEMTFTFTAVAEESRPNSSPARETAYFQPGDEPEEAPDQDVSFVQDAENPDEAISFRLLGVLPGTAIGAPSSA